MVLTAVSLAVGSGVLRLTRPHDPVIRVHEATMTHQHERADTAFRDLFGLQPQIATAAPGRVNLIGEHVDYCGGFVPPMAIERETVIMAARRTVVANEPVARVHSTPCHETVEIPLGPQASRPRRGGDARRNAGRSCDRTA